MKWLDGNALLRMFRKRTKHICKFDKTVMIGGFEFVKCECGMHDLSPAQEEKDRLEKERFDKMIADHNERMKGIK